MMPWELADRQVEHNSNLLHAPDLQHRQRPRALNSIDWSAKVYYMRCFACLHIHVRFVIRLQARCDGLLPEEEERN